MSHTAPTPTPRTALATHAPTRPAAPAPAAASGRTKSTLAALPPVWIARSRPARRDAINADPKRLTRGQAAAPTTATRRGDAGGKNERENLEASSASTAAAGATTGTPAVA